MNVSNEKARDGTRTRDPDLGKVVLHQLSHSRKLCYILYFSQALVHNNTAFLHCQHQIVLII